MSEEVFYIRGAASPIETVRRAPTGVFIQAGTGDQHTKAYVIGSTWDGPWSRQLRWATFKEYFEIDVGRWSTRVDRVTGTAWPTQIGVTPVLRVEPSGG